VPHIELPQLPGIVGLLVQYPQTGGLLNGLADALLRGPSSLSPADRETIAAFVSARNECTFCAETHGAVARHLHAAHDPASGRWTGGPPTAGENSGAMPPAGRASGTPADGGEDSTLSGFGATRDAREGAPQPGGQVADEHDTSEHDTSEHDTSEHDTSGRDPGGQDPGGHDDGGRTSGLGRVDDVIKNGERAEVGPKLQALLGIAEKVRVDGRSVSAADVARAREAGADDKAVHDTVLIAAAFCMFNRYVDGLATVGLDRPEDYVEHAKPLAAGGYLQGPPPRQ
jgi:AhpD family alkylhydroperoxidase